MIPNALAYLAAHYATEEDPEDVVPCRECGRVECVCLESAEDEAEVQA